MATVDEFTTVQKAHKQIEKMNNRMDGSIKELMNQLFIEFGCTTVEEAAITLAENIETEKKKSDKFDRLLKRFRKDFPELSVEA